MKKLLLVGLFASIVPLYGTGNKCVHIVVNAPHKDDSQASAIRKENEKTCAQSSSYGAAGKCVHIVVNAPYKNDSQASAIRKENAKTCAQSLSGKKYLLLLSKTSQMNK